MSKDVVLYLVSSAVALAVGAFVLWGPSPSPRKRKVPIVGLKNLGFTCFLNALLQALASCPIFMDWLELRDEGDSISQSLASILKILSTEPDSKLAIGSDPFSPFDIISSLRRNGWTISPGEQDAHELFHHLILTIEEEVQKCKGKVYGCLSDALIPAGSMPPNVIPSTTSLPGSSVSRKNKNKSKISIHEHPHQPLHTSPQFKSNGGITESKNLCSNNADRGDISLLLLSNSRYDLNNNLKPSPFTGFLTSQTHCTKCGFKSVLRYDKFDSLSLHLPPLGLGRSRHTLMQLLDRFVKTEKVTGVSCDGCNKLTPPDGPTIKSTALKSLSIGKLPRCLCIHIPRTLIHDNGEPYKRQDYVDFPEFLAMDPYTQNNVFRELKLKNKRLSSDNCKTVVNGDVLEKDILSCSNLRKMNHMYRIKAVVVHRGALQGGHFVTYRRGPLKSNIRHRWYLTSDADVRDASLSEALKSPAYMLFYEKCANHEVSM